MKAKLSEAIAKISASKTNDQVVNSQHHTNDNLITTVRTDVARSWFLFCTCKPATVSLTSVVNTSKQTEVICTATHCTILGKAIFLANKQICSKIMTGHGRACLVTSIACSVPTNQGGQAYSYVQPELQFPKSNIL